MNQKQQQLEDRIGKLKAELTELGRLRPGSLSKQARARGSGYFQLTYTHRGKTRCQYVRADYALVIRGEIETYRRFRELCWQWVESELQLSRLKQQEASRTGARDMMRHGGPSSSPLQTDPGSSGSSRST